MCAEFGVVGRRYCGVYFNFPVFSQLFVVNFGFGFHCPNFHGGISDGSRLASFVVPPLRFSRAWTAAYGAQVQFAAWHSNRVVGVVNSLFRD